MLMDEIFNTVDVVFIDENENGVFMFLHVE